MVHQYVSMFKVFLLWRLLSYILIIIIIPSIVHWVFGKRCVMTRV